MGFLANLWPFGKKAAREDYIDIDVSGMEIVGINDLRSGFSAAENSQDLSTDVYQGSGYQNYLWDGEKFPGGYGATQNVYTDYDVLRERSDELFRKNLHARGLERRRLDNVIATGLKLEATPDIETLGMTDEAATAWSKAVERQYELWASTPWLCDAQQRRTLGQLQKEIQREADLEGDVVITLRWSRTYQMPMVDFIRGSLLQTPLKDKPQAGHTIVRGVELDSQNRHVAFWIYQKDGTYKRLPAIGEKSGRRLAWLYHGSDNRAEDVRGTPFLTLIMQGVKEIDRYVAATQRKAVINSMFAAAIYRDVESTGPARSISLMSTPNGPAKIEGTTSIGTPAFARMQQMAPGTILDRLAPGEKIQPFSTNGSIEPIESFVNSHLKHMASANGISPEVFLMDFNKSFSAAQAANNEQKLALTILREQFATQVLTPIYEEWLYSAALSDRIDGQALLDTAFNPSKVDKYIAWLKCEWAGHVKPVVDISKIVPAYAEMVNRGWMTNERATRELTGMKFDDVNVRLKKENLMVLEANKPLADLGLIKGAPISKPEQPAGGGERAANSLADDLLELSDVRQMAN